MTDLHNWYLALSWKVALSILLGAMVVCSLLGAWILQRSEPNARERRLARKRDKAEAKLKAHLRKVVFYVEPNHYYQVGRDAYRDRNGIWRL